MEYIIKPIYTPKERDRLFARLHDKGFKWGTGQSLIRHFELTDEKLPCDVFIYPNFKEVAYNSYTLNGKSKRH